MDEAIVVIPIYKYNLSESEKISLAQVKKVLKNYPICFIAPNKLKSFFYEKDVMVEYFPDECLSSHEAYSDLLLTSEFYERFSKYEYMLIYQLDAFVFFDMLHTFCAMGYDYIGAPTPRVFWPHVRSCVGNGGLSLRKISSCIRVVRNKEDIFKTVFEKSCLTLGEDRFFGYCGGREDIDFNVPDSLTALRFAVEYDYRKCYKHIKESNLPFGCHGWSKPQYYDLWKPYIKMFVDNLDEVSKEVCVSNQVTYKDIRKRRVGDYLYNRALKRLELVELIWGRCLPKNYEYILWGNGDIGTQVRKIITALGRRVICIFDKNCMEEKYQVNFIVKRPDLKLLEDKKYKVIIATVKYQQEIEMTLKGFGLRHGEDYFIFDDIKYNPVLGYYANKWNKYVGNI